MKLLAMYLRNLDVILQYKHNILLIMLCIKLEQLF